MLEDDLKVRRSVYDLNDSLPISDDELTKVVEKCLLNCPTAFNAQSARLVILFGDKHKAYWQMIRESLAKVAEASKLDSALNRLENFAKAYGTIVFYEDTDVLEEMTEKFADYADKMDNWLQQSNAILEYMIWQCLSENKIGASLQHYGNLVEQEAKNEYDLPERWQWVAEMPFGDIAAPAGEKTFEPVEKRLKILK